MVTKSLDALPEDIIDGILTHIPVAQDIANLSKTSRSVHHMIQQHGWQSWTRTAFSPLHLPARNKREDWNSVADRATYLDRCWGKRAFLLHGFQEQYNAVGLNKNRGRNANGRQPGRQPGRQTVGFYPVLDARLVEDESDELLVWGAGEDLVARYKTAGPGISSKGDRWFNLKGSDAGYSAGFGDVTAVSIVERGTTPEVLVGRANGELKLVKGTSEYFGTSTQTLLPQEPQLIQEGLASSSGTSTPRRSPGQQAISWTEWQPQSNMVASCKNSTINLFDISDNEASELSPLVQHDMTEGSPEDELALIRGTKFMSRDTIALALGNSRRPIRWGKITPTGLELFDVPNDTKYLSWVTSRTETDIDVKTTVRAIDSVGPSGNLLLSAWDDGTYRLMDIRTPSEHDAVYRDRWYTYDAASTLLVYGTQRFVAGGKTDSRLHFYDFRYPKPYHHTEGLPCSKKVPQPPPHGWDSRSDINGLDKCRVDAPQTCWHHWHYRQNTYRPDAILHIGSSNGNRVHALAKSSDLASSFYCGMQGAVAEVQLKLAEDVTDDDFQWRTAPSGWRTAARNSPLLRDVGLMENNPACCMSSDWMSQERGFPGMWRQKRDHGQGKSKKSQQTLGKGMRLDGCYYRSTGGD